MRCGMTVRELIEHLQAFDPDLPVVAEGTEYNLPVTGTYLRSWRPTDLAGQPDPGIRATNVAFLTIED